MNQEACLWGTLNSHWTDGDSPNLDIYLCHIFILWLYIRRRKQFMELNFSNCLTWKLSVYLLGLNGLRKYVSGSPFLFEQIVPLSRLTSSDHFGFYCYKYSQNSKAANLNIWVIVMKHIGDIASYVVLSAAFYVW